MLRTIILLGLLLAIAASEASAATIWRIGGVVEVISEPAGDIGTLEDLGVVVGAPFELVFGFRPVPDSDPSPTRASYWFPFTSASLRVAGLFYPFDSSAPVGANSVSHGVDNGRAEYFMAVPLADAESSTFRFAAVTLFDSDSSDLDGESLLTTPPSLGGLDPFDLAVSAANGSTTQLTLVGTSEGSVFSLKGSLSAIQLVPEPSTVVLVLLGLAAIALQRQRQA